MAIDHDKLHEFLGKFVTDLGAMVAAGERSHRSLGRPVQGTGRRALKRLTELARGARSTSPRYIAEWLLGQAAGGYVEHDAATDTYSMNRGAGVRADATVRRRLRARRVRAGARRPAGRAANHRSLPIGQRPRLARSTTRTSSSAASSSSGLATPPTSSRPGFRRSTAWRKSCGQAPAWPTSAAGSAHPPSCSRRSTRNPGSLVLIITVSRLSSPASGRATRASPTGRTSRSPRRRPSPAPATTWPPPSTACTTWVTHSRRPSTSGRRSSPTAPGSSSSPTHLTRPRET